MIKRFQNENKSLNEKQQQPSDTQMLDWRIANDVDLFEPLDGDGWVLILYPDGRYTSQVDELRFEGRTSREAIATAMESKHEKS